MKWKQSQLRSAQMSANHLLLGNHLFLCQQLAVFPMFFFGINIQVFKPALWQLAMANNKMSNSLRTTQLIWLNKNAHTHKYTLCCMARWQTAASLHARLPLFLTYTQTLFVLFPSAFLLYLWHCMQPCVQRKFVKSTIEKKYEYIISCANSAAILLSNVNLPQFYCQHGMRHQRHNNFLMSSCGVACN